MDMFLYGVGSLSGWMAYVVVGFAQQNSSSVALNTGAKVSNVGV